MLGGGLKISSSPWPLTRLESQFTRRTVRVFPRGSGSGRRSPRLVVGVFLADSSDFRSGWASLIIIFIMSVYSDASSEELGDELQSLGWVTRYSPLPSCEEPFSSLEPSLFGFFRTTIGLWELTWSWNHQKKSRTFYGCGPQWWNLLFTFGCTTVDSIFCDQTPVSGVLVHSSRTNSSME